MHLDHRLAAAIVLFGGITASSCSGGGDPEADTCAPADAAFCRGQASFHDRTLAGLGGNGRACSDCHMDAENFQLTPAAALARFTRMTATGIDDPLFRAIDANDFRVNGAAAHDFTNLTQNGLVRVTLPLPANVKLLDCGATVPCPASALPTSETVADVWRAVPSIVDSRITGPDGASPGSPRGPNPSGGYQLDGRIDTLQNQGLSALRNHAGITVDPPASFLDDLAAFQSAQFSSPGVKALPTPSRQARARCPIPIPFSTTWRRPASWSSTVLAPSATATWAGIRAAAPRSSRARQAQRPRSSVTTTSRPPARGRSTTSARRASSSRRAARARCRTCGPTRSRTAVSHRAARPAAAPRRSRPASPGSRRRTRAACCSPATRPRAAPGDIQHMDIPNLRGIGRTAPYFMNNTAATLEEVLEHYQQFFKRVQVQNPAAPLLTTQPGVTPPVIDRPFTDAEVPALLAYLHKL